MHALYSIADLRAVEHIAAEQLPPGALMRRAGKEGFDAALALLHAPLAHARVLVLAGPGNNGGDALEIAAHLAHAGVQVVVWLALSNGVTSDERKHALERAQDSAAQFVATFDAAYAIGGWTLVIDGLLGIGATRALSGELRHAVEQVNRLDCPILALDVPTGLDADTGSINGPINGADGIAVRASHTITFIGDKPGLHTNDGRDYAGIVRVARLDIEARHFEAASMHLNDPRHFARHVKTRRQNSHKGSYGNVAVIGGAHGMTGAPILSARSALLTGAGRVYIAFPDQAPAYDSAHPELMCRLADGFDFNSAALVAGPGLGTSHRAHELILAAIGSGSPLLLDADALNLVAGEPELQTALALRGKSTLLTPHPLEAARLLGIGIAEVQADRLKAARQLAEQLDVIVVLKGSGTVIARPDGHAVINTTGNPALATAGTGDVLAGLCGSLLAQGWPAWEAALGAVWLHGKAADDLVAGGAGPIGLTAGELVPAIRTAFNRLAS
ncbi:NAD(P)H-hydrate dehydratase [Janthinobacterium agaricidamnosum]|uniref:Bifunctional NAD(P)H-hydrate repair enzyme n=1 Tax=Janthinobacterium agaricidamnosum NBRC 102515 = DSM 9628 TaxID=1349767 RepID=W0V700_9BURK|nr:NAD(P)H-hydrate dehydratase [Janthinobacterium agaricidamnosum]CDG83032.1 carbohydrate kinase family protein [Janthinobacterium agaricidamnosum NBRC 102515 = DSM 9628]